MKRPEIASPGGNFEENKATIGLWKVDCSEESVEPRSFTDLT